MSSVGSPVWAKIKTAIFPAKDILNETGYPQLNWAVSGLVLITDILRLYQGIWCRLYKCHIYVKYIISQKVSSLHNI